MFNSYSIKLFSFRGIPVSISLFGLIFIAIFWVFPAISNYPGHVIVITQGFPPKAVGIVSVPDNGGLLIGLGLGVGVVLSIIVHELSHAIVGMIFGAKVISIQLDMLGGATYFASKPLSYLKDSFVSLAGPHSNLALWKICELVYSNLLSAGKANAPGELILIFYQLSFLNLFLAVFNALPGITLDAGQAVHSFTMWLTRREKFSSGLTMVAGLLVASYIVLDTFVLKNGFISSISIGTFFIIYIAFWIASSSIMLYNSAAKPVQFRPTPRQQVERQQQQSEQRARNHAGHTVYEQGRAFLLSKDYQQALDSFNQAIQLEPKEMSYLDYRAYTYAQMGNYGQAIADYNELLEKNPLRADFFAARAAAYKQLGNYDAARYDVTQALSLNPMEGQALQLRDELSRLVR